ncbi:MAG TPA: hypothetical protein VJ903_02525 [Clostridia bacterium]|nr:hypothetical protein [Clostridia bacterium]
MAEKNNQMVASADFDKEKNVGLNADSLSYICDYCGKVNQIGASRCVRCGKRRPRSEYIGAMNKLKTAKSIKSEYLEEQYKIEEEKKDVAQQQLVRLVENRVEEEKQSIYAQENLRVEQEREAIKKSTARDAVLRIIAAEKVAEDKIKEAEQRADDAIKGRAREIDSIIDEEKKKVLEVAAQKVVATRAGIEEAAREQIEANKKIADRFVKDTVIGERDKAERSAARRAVLQIIAAEKAADEKINTAKDALQQAAVERIIEERILADKEASSRYLAEKQAIERAADERIKAEKEIMKKLLEGRQSTFGGNYQSANSGLNPQANYVQPLTIVPYVNSNQPVYQYRPNQVYKFVPRQQQVETNNKKLMGEANNQCTEYNAVEDKKVKSKKVRVTAILSIIIALAILVLGLLPLTPFNFLPESGMPNITTIVGIANFSINVMLAVVGFTAFLAFVAMALVQSIVRVARAKAQALGLVIPLLAVLAIGVTLFGLEEGAIALMPMVFGTLTILLLLFNVIGGSKPKKAK